MTNLTHSHIKRKTGRFDFATFDALPREVRNSINYAAFNCATSNLLGMVRRSGGPAVAAGIIAWDAKRVAEAYEAREANDFLAELGL